MRILVILSDAYGGRGGIALYNRNLLRALCSHPSRPDVVALPRVGNGDVGELPEGLQFLSEATNSKLRFVRVFGETLLHRRYDLVLCSHINLLPFAKVAALRSRAKLVLFIYGRDAWDPGRAVANRLVPGVDAIISIRKHSLQRLHDWSGAHQVPSYILENAFDLEAYGCAPKRPDLVQRYAIGGKRVLFTLARLDEDRHGVDEVLEVLPALLQEEPNLRFVVGGSGAYEETLKSKTRALGIEREVVYTGEVPEAEKADYYRLGDVFVMPGSQALFDTYPLRFSFLEAHACGLPVVGTLPVDLDQYDVHLPNIYVDATDPESIKAGIREGLRRSETKIVPPELNRYAFDGFRTRLWEILTDVSKQVALAS